MKKLGTTKASSTFKCEIKYIYIYIYIDIISKVIIFNDRVIYNLKIYNTTS